ncbi:MAG: hypothetical protein JSU74_11160 [Candidatus Zixiibacteriota bacterium]|nr:MAG: hypothetical protein JSU74_11160 [candidate division Zixibacteria bacterium]
MKIFGRSATVYVLTLLVLIIGAILWSTDLTVDPPTRYCGMGQSLSTDPACCVYHARNEVIFGEADPFNYPRWIVIQRSMVSQVARVWFSIAGVSLEQSNAVGVILLLCSLVFFLLALQRHHRPWVSLVVAVCYMVNITLIVHGRVPYLENGLIFIMSLLFFVYSLWGDRIWGLCLSGALVSAAVLMGKLFGALLLPALLMTVWFSDRENRMRKVLSVVGASAAATVILYLILFGAKISLVYAYLREQSYGIKGFPAGLTSPWAFLEHLVSYGFGNRLFPLSWDLLLFLWAGGLLLTYLLIHGQLPQRISRISALSMFSVGCIFLGLMPQNYSPLRYALILIPPLLMVCFTFFDSARDTKVTGPKEASYVRFIVLFLVVWQALFQIVGMAFFLNNTPIRMLTWSTLPFALVIVYFLRRAMIRSKRPVGRRVINITLVVMILFSLVVNASNVKGWLLTNPNRTIVLANDDLGRILGENAVVSGPYAPVLSLENDLKSFVYYFGVARVDSLLLRQYPITHLAMDESNWELAVKDYPELASVVPSTVYWIRDYGVKICNISRVFGNEEAATYQETDFEKAARYYHDKQFDSAYVTLQQFRAVQPNCWSADLLWAELLIKFGKYQEATGVLTGLANRHPADYYTNLVCGRSLQIIGTIQRNNYLLTAAQKYYRKAVENNRFKAQFAMRLFQQTQQQLNESLRSATP